MFWRKKEKTSLDVAIDKALSELDRHPIDSEEYALILKRVAKLNKMKEKSSSFSKDTLVTVGANLLGILMVINYEKVHVISTKAFALLIKPKV